MRCVCTAKTPKGFSYHPRMKNLYMSCDKHFVIVGKMCPNCKNVFTEVPNSSQQ